MLMRHLPDGIAEVSEVFAKKNGQILHEQKKKTKTESSYYLQRCVRVIQTLSVVAVVTLFHFKNTNI